MFPDNYCKEWVLLAKIGEIYAYKVLQLFNFTQFAMDGPELTETFGLMPKYIIAEEEMHKTDRSPWLPLRRVRVSSAAPLK